MPYRRTTLSKFIIEDQRRTANPQPDVASLLNDVQTACKLIAVAVSRGTLKTAEAREAELSETAERIMVATCEWGGQLAGMVSCRMDEPYQIPSLYPRGRHLLVFDPLDGAANIDVNMPVGTIFSVLRCPEGVEQPRAADFLQKGTAQVAAGYAIYGPTAMMVLTLGAGVHGFTLDPEIGAFTLTHPDLSIPPTTRELAVNFSDERAWEPPVRRYVEECVEGSEGPRGIDINIRWIASLTGEMHRVLMRGGLVMYPRDIRDAVRPARLRLLDQANPMAMLVEQAGGAASTGRSRLLELAPDRLDQTAPVILGSRAEVERVAAYHADYDRGEPLAFDTPLFNARSLFRTA